MSQADKSFFSHRCNWGQMIALNISNRLGGWNASPPSDGKFYAWPRSRHTSERLDHTTQLGFHPPHPSCLSAGSTAKALLIPEVALSPTHPQTLQPSLSLLIHKLSSLQCLLLLMPPPLLHSHIPALVQLSSSTDPWKRPLFCSCWSRMFSSFRGLGMKPMSQPSFTRRPIHQSLLNFCRVEG